MVIPDNNKKTVNIPIKINNGRVEFLYGGDLPKIDDQTTGHLILPANSILDPDKLNKLNETKEIEFLPDKSILLACLKYNIVDKPPMHNGTYLITPCDQSEYEIDDNTLEILKTLPELPKLHIEKTSIDIKGINACYAEIHLAEPLFLEYRGTKLAKLSDCNCYIPSHPRLIADSLNQAYTLLSERYETDRRSHNGNVFNKVFYWDYANLRLSNYGNKYGKVDFKDAQNKNWKELRVKRDRITKQHLNEYFRT